MKTKLVLFAFLSCVFFLGCEKDKEDEANSIELAGTT